MNPESAIAHRKLNLLSGRELYSLAHSWVADGIFSESLNDICFISEPLMCDVGPLMDRAFSELGIEQKTTIDAANYIVLEVLGEIASRQRDPVDGASYLYWKVHFEIIEEHPDSEYLGDNLGLSNVFAWLREVWDCRDGSRILYYTDIPRSEAESKFIQHIIVESQAYVQNAT